MMKLTFRPGAIVKFGFNCKVDNLVFIGKVIEVTKSEVVIIPQEIIEAPNPITGQYSYNISDKYIYNDTTQDTNRKVHIDRDIIAGWEYYYVDTQFMYPDTVRMCDTDSELLNTYINGFCKGSGEPFEL